MAKISKADIATNKIIRAEHLLRIIEALDGTGSAEVCATGSFTGSFTGIGNFSILNVDNLTVFETASVNYLETIYETASVLYSSGSTKFGNTLDDTHEFTGSLFITGSDVVLTDGTFTGDGNGLTNLQAIVSASNSTNDDTIEFLLGTGVSYGVSVNNVENAVSASYSPNFANTDLNLTGNRLHDLNGNDLTISEGEAQSFSMFNGVNTQMTFGSTLWEMGNVYHVFEVDGTASLDLYTNAVGINTNGRDMDFIVSGDTNYNMLFVDAGLNKVGIGTTLSATSNTLHVNGNVFADSYTGSLFGTASWAQNAINSLTASYVTSAQTASFVTASNVFGPYGSNSIISASYAVTASHALGGNGTFNGIFTGSFSGSFVGDASGLINIPSAATSSIAATASYIQGSNVDGPVTSANTASYVPPGVGGIYGGNGTVPSTVVATLTDNITFAGGTILSSSATTLTVVGSGSAVPLASFQGSLGALMEITDDTDTSIFRVNNSSTLPVFEVLDDNTVLQGNSNAPALYTTEETVVGSVGAFTVYELPSASYDGAWFDYTARSGSNARSGQLMAVHNGGTVQFTETTTADIGTTTDLALGVFATGSGFALTGSVASANWTIKTIIRSI